ncbi:Putative LOC100898776 [Caligus rogercresseyi]|uniref:LOC100898776 n=1 Tax=Caligus rogercresseyi TaxID=217165 RepID=A0A7T8KBM6_CALRO|nr:Putative LOC100898776 [Caligus rogercresseyi]
MIRAVLSTLAFAALLPLSYQLPADAEFILDAPISILSLVTDRPTDTTPMLTTTAKMIWAKSLRLLNTPSSTLTCNHPEDAFPAKRPLSSTEPSNSERSPNKTFKSPLPTNKITPLL